MSVFDTIAAVATPPGQGGIAIVRVSGPRALAIVSGIFRGAGGARLIEPRRVYLGHVLDRPDGAPLDEVLVFAMRRPHSYTGEDVVEIQCHGGSIVSRRILESVLAMGARPAQAGEFTKRALLNGRLDLAQAEGVADLIAARTDAGLRLAWSQFEGVLSARVNRLREALLRARALCEAAIDFSDDDIREPTCAEIAGTVGEVRAEIEKLVEGFERAHVRYEGARVVLVGKPNVGKSSLLNALAGHDRAIVTSTPGTTRDAIEAVVSVPGGAVVLIDTAGIREGADGLEITGVGRTRVALNSASCAVVVLDGSRPLDSDDRLATRALAGRAAIVALNKCDLPRQVDETALVALMGAAAVVEVSALTEVGLTGLATEISKAVFGSGGDQGEEEAMMFRIRHRDAALHAVEALERARQGLAGEYPLELLASDLSEAARALGEITGMGTAEDVLDKVFADFCIGK